jgi:ankyrin repeat protein
MAEDLDIHAAAHNGDVDAMRQALDNGVSPDAKDSTYGFTPLHWLCGGEEEGDRVACLNLLVARGVNVNAGNDANVPPLQFAILQRPALVPLLLDAGADPNYDAGGGDSALQYAFLNPDHDSQVVKAMVQALISAGADVNMRNRSGYTPLESGIVSRNMDKLYPIFFRAGAALPSGNDLCVYAENSEGR